MPTATQKRRGAQPGNLNALRHGYYSRVFQETETADLETMLATGLQDEINALRVVTRRMLTLAQDQDLNTTMNTLGALGMAATRLAGLLKTQRMLGSDSTDTSRAIADAIAGIVQELSLR